MLQKKSLLVLVLCVRVFAFTSLSWNSFPAYAKIIETQNSHFETSEKRNTNANREPDYLHLTKRFGIVAASQLPLHYLLAFKAWSPVQYLTRLSHEELNPYHRFLGRIIIAFFCLHASMYLNFFVQKGILLKRIRDWDVILGLTAIATVLLIASTALAKVRTWNYRLFLNLHVILSVSLLPTLYLHVSHLRIYVLEAAALYVLLIIQRNISQASANATVKILPNTNLLFITIPLNKTLSAKTFTPGQHIYLGFPSLSQKLRINPFSIANPHPQTDKQIQLVARTLSGTTAILSTLAKGPQPTPLLIEGPYGSSAKFPDFANYDRILFIAGGVGATFTLPIYIDILQRAAKGEPMPATRFVWTVRKEADAQWGIDQLHYQLGKLPDIELHVSLSQTQISPNARREHHSSRRGREDVGAIEMQQAQTPNGILNVSSESANIARKGRPDLKTIVDHIFEHDSNDRVAVLVCGPLGMGKSLRRQIWGWVQKAREVFWHNEEFGW